MEEVRIVKVVDDGNSTKEFIEEFKAVVEWYHHGKMQYATPVTDLEDLFSVLGDVISFVR